MVHLVDRDNERVGGQVGHALLNFRHRFLGRIQDPVLVVFAQVDAFDTVVGVGGPVMVVFVGNLVDKLRIEMAQFREFGAPGLGMGQPPRGPFRPRLSRHERFGIRWQIPHAPVGRRPRSFPYGCTHPHLLRMCVQRSYSTVRWRCVTVPVGCQQETRLLRGLDAIPLAFRVGFRTAYR